MVVGAASGLGAAAARSFSDQGARLVLVDRNAEDLQVVRSELGLNHLAVSGDATDPDTAGRANAAFVEPVDVLFVAAGIDPLGATNVLGTSLADWRMVIDVNVTASFIFAKEVLPSMLERGKGSMVFTASISGIKPTPSEAAYSVSKAALIQLTRSIALDYAGKGIRANCICPGYLEQVMQDRLGEMSAQDLAARSAAASSAVPMGREGSYSEIAEIVLFLSDASRASYITGQAVVADGGVLLA